MRSPARSPGPAPHQAGSTGANTPRAVPHSPAAHTGEAPRHPDTTPRPTISPTVALQPGGNGATHSPSPTL
eukprot:2277628-Prorocentrum_lima.AAC.1